MKARNYGFDLLRVVLCIFVIAIHSMNFFYIKNVVIDMSIPTFLKSTNGLFYMLSGYFNLEKKFENSDDIIKFYKNKIIYVLLPFLGFNLFWVAWDFLHAYGAFDVVGFLKLYYETVMCLATDGHMWFMYPLFGLLLSTPFLSKMLHSMNEKELKILWRTAIGFNFIAYYLCENFGVGFAVSSWVLDGWIIYYFAGYYYRHVISKESAAKWLILGTVGFVITVLGVNYKLPVITVFAGGNDIQPMFTLFCVGFLYVWEKIFRIENKTIGKIIVFLSSNTFLIYLFHVRGLEYVVRKLNIIGGNLQGLIAVFGTFVVSLVAASVINFVMKPVQKKLYSLWTTNN